MYQQVLDKNGLVTNEVIQRLSDKAFIPNDNLNRDWKEYQKWLNEGNQPLPPG